MAVCLTVAVLSVGAIMGMSGPEECATVPASVPIGAVAPAPVASPTVIVRTETIRTMPINCALAVDQVKYMQDSLYQIINSSGREISILSKARTSIVAKDVSGLNTAGESQYKLMRDTTDARQDVLARMDTLLEKMKACDTDIKALG